ncbi:MAG: LLM class flavin-dependent oxidoreductase [Ktedonobacterales bacterium]
MRFGLDVPTTGAFADPRALAQLATDAEAAGWDGFFLWDVLHGGSPAAPEPVADPWIALTAITLRTTRLRLGLFVCPLARHRPWLVARRLAILDQLSGGRVTCAVGLGANQRDFSAFGEASAPDVRARKLDEGLAILAGLWTEDAFSFSGQHYSLDAVTLHPRPLQSPRIPLWVAGGWPRRAPFRRAARWDGVCLKSRHTGRHEPLTVDDFRACLAYVQAQRHSAAPFDIVMSGESPSDPRQADAYVRPFASAGATWWIEEGLGWSFDEFRARILAGPPRPADTLA